MTAELKKQSILISAASALTAAIAIQLLLATGATPPTLFMLHESDLAANFPISIYGAKKLIDMATSWQATVAALVFSAGWNMGLIATAKWAAGRYGKKRAAAW